MALDRASRPLVDAERGGIHVQLPRDEIDHVVVQLHPPAREPAESTVELQQQRKAELGVAVLRRD
jgi:hypothetical protein